MQAATFPSRWPWALWTVALVACFLHVVVVDGVEHHDEEEVDDVDYQEEKDGSDEGLDDIYPSAEDDKLDPEMQIGNSEEIPPMEAWQLRELFTHMDQDSDGKLTVPELLAYAKKTRRETALMGVTGGMIQMDKDKDGKITLEEALAFEEMEMLHEAESPEVRKTRVDLERRKFQAADSDKNGVLDETELPGFLFPEANDAVLDVVIDASFAAKDLDRDGKLSLKEFFGADVKGRLEQVVDVDGAGEDFAKHAADDFSHLDQDGDDFVDIIEFSSFQTGSLHEERALRRMHDLADANADGFVTETEIEAARVAIAKEEAHWYLHQWDWHEQERSSLGKAEL